MPGLSRVYVTASVPTVAASSATGAGTGVTSIAWPPRQLVAAPRQLLLRLEQLEPRCEPLFTCPGHVLRHRSSLSFLRVSFASPAFPSNCLASASVFAPMDVLPSSFGMQPSLLGPETLSRSRLLTAAL